MAPVMQLSLPLPDGVPAVVTAEGSRARTLLGKLAGVLRLTPEPVSAPPPEADFALADDGEPPAGFQAWPGRLRVYARMCWEPAAFRFHLRLADDLPPQHHLPIVRRILNLALLRRTLRGGASVMLHGALLRLPETGRAVVLFAASGVGKSTAAQRFAMQGGTALADDKLLLTFLPDGRLLAQPTPTWSRLAVHRDISVAFAEPVPVAALLMLVRGDDDRIEKAADADWRIALCRGFGDVLFTPVEWLPEAVRKRIMAAALPRGEELRRRFGTYQLCGDLNGAIFRRLTDFVRAETARGGA